LGGPERRSTARQGIAESTKSEARNPKQSKAANPKLQQMLVERSFEISDFGFVSDFGFRFSGLGNAGTLSWPPPGRLL
jgi:hypothetical protein